MRKFEKISVEQFNKDVNSPSKYEEYILPKRMTQSSAGYDFFSIIDLVINPFECQKIPTGIKAKMNKDEVLLLFVRSSMGFKYNVRMVNQVGIIDADYYNNIDNEGHIWIKLQNEGEKPYIIKKGDRICQGIFIKYLTVDDENNVDNIRLSGLGSTNEEE